MTVIKMLIMLISVMLGFFSRSPTAAGEYGRYAMLTDVIKNEMVFTDTTENMWGVEYSPEYNVGEYYVLVMHSKGTRVIYDDVIIEIVPAEEYNGSLMFAYANYEDYNNLYLEEF